MGQLLIQDLLVLVLIVTDHCQVRKKNNFPKDKQLCRTLMGMFTNSTTTTLKKLREAIAKEDSKTLYLLTHNLAGSAATLGAVSLLEAVRVLENTSKQGNNADKSQLLAGIEVEFDKFKAEASNYLAGSDD